MFRLRPNSSHDTNKAKQFLIYQVHFVCTTSVSVCVCVCLCVITNIHIRSLPIRLAGQQEDIRKECLKLSYDSSWHLKGIVHFSNTSWSSHCFHISSPFLMTDTVAAEPSRNRIILFSTHNVCVGRRLYASLEYLAKHWNSLFSGVILGCNNHWLLLLIAVCRVMYACFLLSLFPL